MKLLRIAYRVAGFIFLAFGVAKFANHGVEVDSFRTYALQTPDAFVYLIGVIEVAGVHRPLAGSGTRIAAPVLAADMIGAIVVSGAASGSA